MSDGMNRNERFSWISMPEQKGELLFTFDGERIFNLFRDYPHELSDEQKKIFDEENPYWADFFNDEML